ncbi:MAG TPA: hypothetical protein VHZ04_00265 [Candidatus Paceibacterota bacterium]|jgi:hypothetical protein|nr:hypothetical protein [Candidatus Paceibacterota bacterium]
MPDQISSYESALEADIERLAAQIRIGHELPEMRTMGGQEIVKEALRAFPQLDKNIASQSAPGAPASAPRSASDGPLPAYAQNAPTEVKLEIEYLLDTAFRQGIGKALAESKKSPYFVQDAFHDALAGKLYPELKKRGVLK